MNGMLISVFKFQRGLCSSLLTIFVGLTVPVPARACLWDRDTLKEETLGLKDVADIVGGRIGKHSAFFYEQKVAYTTPLLARPHAAPELYDDLAVAYDKLGRTDEALAVMADKERRFPGAYTTASNTGTFYSHRGDHDRALEHLRKALAINPSAHFGREKYQVMLVEYLRRLAERPSCNTVDFLGLDFARQPETSDSCERIQQKLDDFALRDGSAVRLRRAGLSDDAPVAIAGLIRFGSGDRSPHLWFALGNVLGLRGHKHLALRAYRRAEVLGHSMPARYAPILLMHVASYALRMERLGGPSALGRLWKEIGVELDGDWERGQAWSRQQQEHEDAELRRGHLREVFGY